MKRNILFYTSAAVITYLLSVLASALTAQFPITGTVGIEGEKVSYLFPREIHSKNGYTLVIRSDADSLTGSIDLLMNNDPTTAQRIEMKNEGNNLIGYLPHSAAGSKLYYTVTLEKNGLNYQIPPSETIITQYWSKVPTTLWVLYYFTLLGGLFFAIRAGLEYFATERVRLILYTLIASTLFSLHAILVNPVFKTYELNAFRTTVPSPDKLFAGADFVLPALWIFVLAIVRKVPNPRITLLGAAIVTVVMFLVVSFFK